MKTLETGKTWRDGNGNIFVVASVQDGVVFYVGKESSFACSEESFLERFTFQEPQ